MTFFILALIVIVLLFCSVVFFGAPYLPTLSIPKDVAFELLGLKKGQHLLELGSGDGRILAYAARRGIYATGYELNPLLVLYTKIRYYRYRRYIKVYCRNYWSVSWPETDAIYVFLLDKYMKKLDKKVIQSYSKPVKLVSFAFKIPHKRPESEKGGMYLYQYE